MSTETCVQKDSPKEYTTFRFVDYKVYQESKKWLQEILALKGILDATPDVWYQLKSNVTQLVMNITAASTKLPNDAKRDLGNCITNANKVVACLDIACDLQAITPEEFQTLTQGFKGIIIQLKCFIKAIGTRKEPEAIVAA